MAFEQEQKLLTILIQKQLLTQQQAVTMWNEFISNVQKNKSVTLSGLLMEKSHLTAKDLQDISHFFNEKSKAQQGLAIGENFNHYHVEAMLGRGGMGAVYKVHDHKLNRKVALKIILGANIDEKIIERFLIEAKAMAQLRHPNIVEIYDVGEYPQNYFIMEYVEGNVFAKEIEKGTLDAKQIAHIMLQCARAVAEIHKYKIVHRDIKPSNIMLTKKRQVKLMDFGLAKMTDNNLSYTGELLGTPFFMSPEQAAGSKVGKKSDIYSLGASLYMALTKAPPFQGESVYNTLNHILNKEPVFPRLINPDIPVDLESICLKCLEKKPSKRYATAVALAEDLENFIHNRPVHARPITHWGKLCKWTARNTKIAIISAVALVAIIASIIFTLYSFKRQISVEKTARLAALQAQQKAVNEMQRAQTAEKKAHQAQKEAEAAQEVAEVARKAAVKSEKKAQISAYNANIALANLFLKENKVLEVENSLNACPEDLRGWEWQWLKGENNDEYMSLKEHNGHVLYCTVSGDGKYMASLCSDNRLIIWNFATKTPRVMHVITCTKNAVCYTCTFSPDGKQLAVAGKHVELYDVVAARVVATLKHKIPSQKVVFTKDGKTLIACYRGKDQKSGGNRETQNSKISLTSQQTIVVWDLEKRSKRKTIIAHQSEFLNNINDCDIKDNWLLTAGDDTTVRLWNIKTGKELQRFAGHEDQVSCCRFAPQGKMVSTSYDKTLIVWDIKTAKKEKVLNIHDGRVYYCAITPDEQNIVSVGEDQKLIITDIQSGEIKQVFTGHKGVSFSQALTQRHFAVISSCTVTPDGQTIVTSGNDRTLKLWNLSKKNPQTIAKLNSKIVSLSFSPDSLVITNAPDIAVRQWSIHNNKVTPIFSNFLPSRMSIFNKKGDKVLVACVRFLRLFSTENKKQLFEFVGLGDNVISCAYSPDGTKVAAGCYNDRVHIWDASSLPQDKQSIRRDPSQIIETGSDVIYCTFNHNNDIATANNWSLRLNNSKTGETKWSLPHDKGERFRHCAFSQDDKWLLAAHGNEIWLVDAKSGKKLRVFVGHNAEVSRCRFINNDTQIISTSYDRTIKIWSCDLENSDEKISPLFTLGQNHSAITAMAISHDERLLAIGSEDGQVNIWTNYGK